MKFKTKYNINDYIGKRFGRLTVVGTHRELKKDGSKQWEFMCDCGSTVIETPYRVISGHKQSCGCMGHTRKGVKNTSNENCHRVSIEDFIGKTNNSLTVIGMERNENGGRAKLKCLCTCGNITYVYPYQFSKGKVRSCGCLKTGPKGPHDWDNNRKTHGQSGSRIYARWAAMISRCYNKNADNYEGEVWYVF